MVSGLLLSAWSRAWRTPDAWLHSHLRLLQLAQVLAFESTAHKGIAEPPYQGIARCKRKAAEGNGRDEGLAFTLQRVGQNTDAC
jgi:hypothetical protein